MRDKKQPETFENRNNYKLYIALLFLCAYGLIMIYSITALECGASEKYEYNSFHFVGKQAFFMLLGFGGILFFQIWNYRILKVAALISLPVAILCMVLLTSPLGVTVNGATRWLNIKGMQFQVSEVVKLSCILIIAWFIESHEIFLKQWVLLVSIWVIGVVIAGILFVLSDDFSSSMVVFGICFVMGLVCTQTPKLHLAAIAGGITIVVTYVYSIWQNMPTTQEIAERGFRVGRIASWLDPDRYPDLSYQWYQGMYAVARGGFLGKGLGNSLQKNIIPEPHNDFVFAILLEEMGFVGGSVLVFLFVYLLYQIIRVALASKDSFARAMLVGVFAHIGVQTIFNMSVTLGVLPNTGLPMPFISYGGTSVAILMGAEMAIVFAVERSFWRRPLLHWIKLDPVESRKRRLEKRKIRKMKKRQRMLREMELHR